MQQDPIVITATPLAESSTPHVIVVTATVPVEVTLTTKVTPRPTPTPRPQWQPILISSIEAAFSDDGYSRNPLVDDAGDTYFVWVKENRYERVRTWEDGTLVLEVLHDKSPEVRADRMEQKLRVLDRIFPSGFMAELRVAHDNFNASVGPTVSGEPDELRSYGGRWQRVNAEYSVTETIIGGYRIRFSLWWRQATCPPEAYYCYYVDFPGLEFTGDSSLVFYTIRLTPLDEGEDIEIPSQLVLATQASTPTNVGIGWEFNTRGDDEGWEVWGDLGPLNAANGVLRAESTGSDPYMESPLIWLDAAEFPVLEFRMKLISPMQHSDGGLRNVFTQFFFITATDPNFDGKKSVRVPDILPWALFKKYRVDMSTIEYWKGTITQIRLDPMAENGEIEIDYIRLTSKEPERLTATP